MVKEFKEKTITINLRNAFQKPETKRAKAALSILKKAIFKETRKKKLKISNKVNELIWSKGLKKSIRKITVKIIPEKDFARVILPNEKIEIKENEKKQEKGKEETKEQKEVAKEK